MNARERELRRKLGISDDAEQVLIFEQSAHCDWNWYSTHPQYYESADHNNQYYGVIDILSDAFIGMAQYPQRPFPPDEQNPEPYTYAFCEVGYLRDFRASITSTAPTWGWPPLPTVSQWADAVNSGRFHFSSGGITSAENLVVHTEAFIRNYLIGRKWVADNFGVRPSLQMWIPDDFGHDAQLPVLLQAMGFIGAGFWRIPAQWGGPNYGSVGTTVVVDHKYYKSSAAAAAPSSWMGSGATQTVDFIWQARDGSQIQAHWLRGGYGQGNSLDGYNNSSSVDVSSSVGVIQGYINYYVGFAPTRYTFVPIDNDFCIPYENFPDVVLNWNKTQAADTNVVTVMATFDDFMRLVAAANEESNTLPLFQSNPSAGNAYLPHPYWSGCYATFPAIKRLHYSAVRMLLEAEALELALEYLASTSQTVWRFMAETARANLAAAWNLLAASTHHDYITGTVPNTVYAAEVLPRLQQAALDAAGARLYVQHALTAAISVQPGIAGTAVALFNPVALPREGLAEITVPLAKSYTSFTKDGRWFAPVQAIAEDRLLTLAALPALGYTSGFLGTATPSHSPALSISLSDRICTLQNEFVKVTIDGFGITGLYDLRGSDPSKNLFGKSPGEYLNGNAIRFFVDSGTIYRFGSEQIASGMTFEPVGDWQQTANTIAIEEQGPLRVSVRVTRTEVVGSANLPFSFVYRLVADEKIIRVETTGAAPPASYPIPGYSVLAGFPFGASTPIAELAYGTTAHWDQRAPRGNFIAWTDERGQPSGAPPAVQDMTFEPTHEYVLPLAADGSILGAIYHHSTPAWAIDLSGQTVEGCILRNAPSGGQGASAADTQVHTQIYAVRVPSGLALPSAGCGHGTPLGEALLFNNPVTGMPIDLDTAVSNGNIPMSRYLPASMSIAAIEDATAIVTVAKAGTVDASQMIVRLYQPTDQSIASVTVAIDATIAGMFQDGGALQASLVTALEQPASDHGIVRTTASSFTLPLDHAMATVALNRPA